jgi:biopolymer transport protein ExbD
MQQSELEVIPMKDVVLLATILAVVVTVCLLVAVLVVSSEPTTEMPRLWRRPWRPSGKKASPPNESQHHGVIAS